MTIGRTSASTVALGALALGLLACADDSTSDDATGPAATAGVTTESAPSTVTALPESTESPETTPGSSLVIGQQPDGFTTIQAEITDADGGVCEVCLWLADDATERGRGLMGVTDLGDAVGMAFVFDEATTGSFYMFQTPTPLSIAWFSPDGDHVGSAEMEPCLDTPAGECPLYSPDSAYDLAIEVFDGGLDPLGLGPGSRVVLIEGSESDRCAAAA
jgi:hypothetical protein